jgi:hypothetical protein
MKAKTTSEKANKTMEPANKAAEDLAPAFSRPNTAKAPTHADVIAAAVATSPATSFTPCVWVADKDFPSTEAVAFMAPPVNCALDRKYSEAPP